ncbi:MULTISPECIES: hypothetical protein [unclassified Curtobacterium]|uniref:hypothetical protein n=1 Tax=unclassified Curtobacterium TaxID=257496 RepID=UPI0037FCDB48
MSMSTPFDPEQQGSAVPVDGRDEDELEVEEARSAEPDSSAAPLREQDEAGGGPVFRRPQAGDRLSAQELSADTELDS